MTPHADWRDVPLAGDGRSLIEASAGTGKTWAIAALYLRLLLEQGLSPTRIVVTTFTIAAAQELRERIHARLLEATALAGGVGAACPHDAKPGSVVAWLFARWNRDASARATDRNRLRLAIAELDLAPITTLHGLCRKVLADHPFESGNAFVAGELIANDALDRDLRDDFWRRIAQADPATLDAGDRAWFEAGHGKFDDALERVCAPGTGVRLVTIDQAKVDEAMRPGRAVEIRAFVAKARFKRADSVMRRGLGSLAAFIEAGDVFAPWHPTMDADLGKDLESQFSKDYLDAARDDPAIAFARHAVAILRDVPIAARCAALARHRETLLRERERRLREADQLTFDALIARTLDALRGEHGAALADCLREEWPVALVDEFQDTDAQQYAILDRVYRDGDGAVRGRLVMIGDPKQAIYRFRGGDIDAYHAARAHAGDHLELLVNRRSSLAYVAACNDLFALAGPALGQDPATPIRYVPVTAAGEPRGGALTIDGQACERPLVFHFHEPRPDAPVEDGGKGKGRSGGGPSRDAALEACANQIAGLLQARGHRIGGRLLAPGDLAVLVPANDDIARLRKLLAARRVPCVGAGKSGVFQSDVARELQVLLHAIEHAHDGGAVRAALATRFFGLGYADLRALVDATKAWDAHARHFAAWRTTWHNGGVQAAIQAVVAANARRLAGAADHERMLTDLRHLGELLQQASGSCNGPASLLAWFTRQREGDGAASDEASDEQQLRIESDARRVRLLTVHASKGLQFPVVFLPLPWTKPGAADACPRVRDAASGARLVDFGGPGHADALAGEKRAAEEERFRLLYVALTRAQHACHVYAPDESVDPQGSALQALLARIGKGADGRVAMDASAYIGVSRGWDWPRVDYVPDRDETGAVRRVLALPGARPYVSRHSFSTLSHYRSPLLEDEAATDETVVDATPADDPAAGPVRARDEPADGPAHADIAALAGLRGTGFGNAMHAVFERRQLTVPLAGQLDFVHQCLREADLAPDALRDEVVARIAARVQGVLDAPLQIEGASPLVLAALPANRQRAELEFHYRLDDVSMQALRAACAAHGEGGLVPAAGRLPLRGFMTGKIDLVCEHAGRFHVLDYKGNHLGDSLAAYAPARLGDAMDAHAYRFQALLYTIALDRYLRQRKPRYLRARDLGGAIYLFVRAVGLTPGAGVWTHRFDDALIVAVDAVLANRTEEHAA